MPLPLLILLLPVLELWLMIEIGSWLGALAVIGWLVLMVVVGINLLRYLGASAMLRSAQNLRSGSVLPAQSLADNLFKALGAVLLIIPGFLTDLVALLCFVPFFRRLMLKRWLAKMAAKASASGFYAAGFRPGPFNRNTFEGGDAGPGNVYDHPASPEDHPGPTGARTSKTGLLIDQKPDSPPADQSKKP